MSDTPFMIVVVIVVNLITAAVVLLTNPVRLQNRTFFIFSVLLGIWALCVQIVITTHYADVAALSIRLAQYVTLLFPSAFQALCLSMATRDASVREVFRGTRVNLALSQACGILVFTPLFLRGVAMPTGPNLAPIADYGPAFPIVQLYNVLAFFAVIVHFFRVARKLDGIQKAELQFTLLGVASGLLFATITSLILQLALPEEFVPQQFGPLAIFPLNLIIAYGVATHRILDVSAFLQRATAYLVLGVYLLILYIGVNYAAAFALERLDLPTDLVSHLLAALAVAFSVSPVQGILQKLSHKLFISRDTLDVRDVTKRGNEIFASISTTQAILERFLKILDEGGIDAIQRTILLPTRHEFVAWKKTGHPRPEQDLLRLPLQNALIRDLQTHHATLATDTLRRMRPTPATRSVLRALGRLEADLAVGIFFKDNLRGIVLLGPRKSGRIYSSAEQDALRVLCDQLAVALENADLYTKVQNNKIYNDILVDSLPSGVIAVSSDGYISVFNREAQRMTGLPAGTALGRAVEVLPGELAHVLRETLRTGQPARDQETLLRVESGDDVPIRYGSSLFHGSQRNILGALIVFSDQTAQKKLEMQVRRSDRLASIGTLSAGMAHEIKNPLVTVKTFAELLPERYQDEDFRNTFSNLVSKEVQRIDSIVNQLLRFARPAKADLKPVSLQQVLAGPLELFQEQLRQKDVKAVINLNATEDRVRADANLLDQAFINLLFNAIDAMEPGGTLTVSTSTTQPPWHLRQQYHIAPGELYVRTTIRDTGSGIAPDAIDSVFDPFFTTKEHGTGLGLSISHGIITEHDGLIDVESQIGVGSAFHIYIPLLRQEAAVP